jgi:hypothetical protein
MRSQLKKKVSRLPVEPVKPVKIKKIPYFNYFAGKRANGYRAQPVGIDLTFAS